MWRQLLRQVILKRSYVMQFRSVASIYLSLATRKMEISRGCFLIFLIFTRDLMVTEDNFDMPLKEKARRHGTAIPLQAFSSEYLIKINHVAVNTWKIFFDRTSICSCRVWFNCIIWRWCNLFLTGLCREVSAVTAFRMPSARFFLWETRPEGIWLFNRCIRLI